MTREIDIQNLQSSKTGKGQRARRPGETGLVHGIKDLNNLARKNSSLHRNSPKRQETSSRHSMSRAALPSAAMTSPPLGCQLALAAAAAAAALRSRAYAEKIFMVRERPWRCQNDLPSESKPVLWINIIHPPPHEREEAAWPGAGNPLARVRIRRKIAVASWA